MEDQEYLYDDDYPRKSPSARAVLPLLRCMLTITLSRRPASPHAGQSWLGRN